LESNDPLVGGRCQHGISGETQMAGRRMGQTKRTIVVDEDIMSAFEDWADETAMSRKWAVQVAFWAAMKLTPSQRQALVSEIRQRAMDASPPISDKGLAMVVPSFCPFITGKKGNCTIVTK
jgi:vacuolar-type H+-ATPase catalytic subunit A/Vma1